MEATFIQDSEKTKTNQVKTTDGFENFASRLGVSPRGEEGSQNNQLGKGFYEFNLLTRNRVQLEAAYRGSWIAGRVINTVAEDMTRAGIEINTNEGAEDVQDIQVHMSRLQIWQSLRSGTQWGRLYGGACAVLQIKGQDLATPINYATIKKGDFQGLVVYDRWQIYPELINTINVGPEMGLPEYYNIVLGTNPNDVGREPNGSGTFTTNPNGQVRVHHSRCIRMIGLELPFWQAITEMMWGESVLERMWDRLIAFDTATLSIGNLINRAQLRTVGVDGLREILAMGGDQEKALIQQFEYMRMFQQNEGITLLDKNDVFASTAYTFTGLSDVVIQMGQQVSGSAEIPLVSLFGQSPAGLSATGESDIRLYYDSIKTKQESKLRNGVEMILKVMWPSVTGNPAPSDLTFEFTPLWQMSATDKANIAKTNADTITSVHASGGVDTATMMKELKQASGENGLFTHITDEMIEEAENEEPPAPEAEVTPPEIGSSAEPNSEEIPGSETGFMGGGPTVAKDAKNDLKIPAWKKIRDWLKGQSEDRGVEETMKEFEKGTLKSSSGKKVTSKKQALAIGYSEERE